MVTISSKRNQISSNMQNMRPIVNTELGAICGFQERIEIDKYVNVFLGVPYAEAPVGELRFQKPRKKAAWTGVLSCHQYSACAPQKLSPFEKFYFRPLSKPSEDCLYLNVFAPAWKPKEIQPHGFAVLIFIHGGAFCLHSSAYYRVSNICRYLCSKDVIIITIQYRLGILGFGTTGEPDSPSNLGLWDQAQALDWVKTNIASFGGNPDNITVFGQSAGAAAADLLSLSPYTRDKFDKVIAIGGSANCEWVMSSKNNVRQSLAYVACKLGWKPPSNRNESDTNSDMLKFLKKQPAQKLSLRLQTRFKSVDVTRTIKKLHFTPIIDGDFLPEPIAELRRKAPKKICMTGTTDCEGLILAFLGHMRYDRKAFLRLIRASLPEGSTELVDRAVSMYLEDGLKSKKQYCEAFMKLYGDFTINNGVYSYAQEMSTAGHSVYLYSFDYHPQSFGAIGYFLPFLAASHGTELPYLFGKTIIHKYKFLPRDYCVLNNFSTLVTNFAKYGSPNTTDHQIWKPLNATNPSRYLSINEMCTMKTNYQGCRPCFWNGLRHNVPLGNVVPLTLS